MKLTWNALNRSIMVFSNSAGGRIVVLHDENQSIKHRLWNLNHNLFLWNVKIQIIFLKISLSKLTYSYWLFQFENNSIFTNSISNSIHSHKFFGLKKSHSQCLSFPINISIYKKNLFSSKELNLHFGFVDTEYSKLRKKNYTLPKNSISKNVLLLITLILKKWQEKFGRKINLKKRPRKMI